MRVAITRPRREAERTAVALRSHGYEVLVAPLLRIEPLAADLSGDWGAIVITSANAPHTLSDKTKTALLSLPLFAVGDRSAEAAKEAGFTDVYSARGDIHELVRLVAGQRGHAEAPVLYLAGADRASDLVHELGVHNVSSQLRIIYRAIMVPFPDELVNALTAKEIEAVLHFSKRSVENYLAGSRAAGIVAPALAVQHLCLSKQIATPLKAAGATEIAISARPEETALIELLSTLPAMRQGDVNVR